MRTRPRVSQRLVPAAGASGRRCLGPACVRCSGLGAGGSVLGPWGSGLGAQWLGLSLRGSGLGARCSVLGSGGDSRSSQLSFRQLFTHRAAAAACSGSPLTPGWWGGGLPGQGGWGVHRDGQGCPRPRSTGAGGSVRNQSPWRTRSRAGNWALP